MLLISSLRFNFISRHASVVFKDLWLEDKDKNKDLRSKDKDKDL